MHVVIYCKTYIGCEIQYATNDKSDIIMCIILVMTAVEVEANSVKEY